MLQKIKMRIDVTEAAGVGATIEMAATLTLPDPADLPSRPIVIFAVPGGGYSRGYYDMRFAGHEGYSEAEWHAARGILHVAIDHVGVGDSTIPDLAAIDFGVLAGTHDACVRAILARLAAGA